MIAASGTGLSNGCNSISGVLVGFSPAASSSARPPWSPAGRWPPGSSRDAVTAAIRRQAAKRPAKFPRQRKPLGDADADDEEDYDYQGDGDDTVPRGAQELLGLLSKNDRNDMAASLAGEHGMWMDAIAILREAVDEGAAPNPGTYAAAVRACARGQQWQRSLQILGQAEAAGVATSAAYAAALEGLAERWEAAMLTFHRGLEATEPTADLLRNLVPILGSNGLWKQILLLLEEKQFKPLRRDGAVSEALMLALERSEQSPYALRVFEEFVQKGGQKKGKVKPTITMCKLAIRYLAAGGRWQEAMGLLDDLEAQAWSPDISTYNHVITSYKALGAAGVKPALALVRSLETKGVAPNLATYCAVISVCDRAHEVDLALKLLAEMPEVKLDPQTFVFNAAMNACARSARWVQAMDLLRDLKGRGLQPDVVTYDSAILACQRSLRWKEALGLVHELSASEIPPDSMTYPSAISACAKGRSWEWALELFQEMKDKNMAPDIFAFGSLVSAFERGRKWGLALILLEEMSTGKVPPNLITYNTAIGACDHSIQWQWGIELLSRMKGDMVTPDTVTYSAGISACNRGKAWVKALELVEEMQENGMQPDIITYATVVGCCRRHLRVLSEALDECADEGAEERKNAFL
eukprot:TRINITY_DN33592_c3_g1_i1.p1 TRINITY_DN33592_c3_g1~~TRINITY_DN33592_c3_g1_i1.p1  ORF type:complete len:639 (-),score=153.19 TRINITY_DN33592_c3_g1_i1:398-2314(-)